VTDDVIFDGGSGQETDTMPGTEQEEMEGIPDEEDQESSGNYPVGETSNGLPVFLNISKEGKPYLSIWDKETLEDGTDTATLRQTQESTSNSTTVLSNGRTDGLLEAYEQVTGEMFSVKLDKPKYSNMDEAMKGKRQTLTQARNRYQELKDELGVE